MWWTPNGERILQGAEAALFREALGVIADLVCDDDEDFGWKFGAPPFDAMMIASSLWNGPTHCT